MRFLKHLVRTRLLLHIVDMAPYDGSDPAQVVKAIAGELKKFSPTLASRDRWLVLNKLDLLPKEQHEELCRQLVEDLDWQGPVYQVSAIKSVGLQVLCRDIMTWIDDKNEAEAKDEELAQKEQLIKEKMQQEARENLEAMKSARKAQRLAGEELEDDFDDDEDDDVEVVYAQ